MLFLTPGFTSETGSIRANSVATVRSCEFGSDSLLQLLATTLDNSKVPFPSGHLMTILDISDMPVI